MRDSGAHELQSMLQPFGPMQPTEKVAPNLAKLQTLDISTRRDQHSVNYIETNVLKLV